jgi:thiosulfate/3-mercaptopyruvate sulfurtransferase
MNKAATAITAGLALAAVVVSCGISTAAAAQANPSTTGQDAAAPYASPELLVGTSWAEAHLADRDVRVIDMRDEKAYAAGHLPGAVRVEEGPLRDPEDRFTYLPRPAAFAAMMSRAGISNGTHVVLYDDQGGKMAVRLWYVLNAFGHKRVSLINGGWNRWAAEKRPVSTQVPVVAATRFTVRETPEMACALPHFLGRRKDVVVLDARSADEYAGRSVSPKSQKAGRVPGAVNVEWKENVAGPHLEFRPAADLKRLYTARGITPDKQIVVYCASGGRAAQTLFTLMLLGYPKVKVYYGSFSDYAALPDAPIEK